LTSNGNVAPSEILAHLVLNYGTVIALDVDANDVRTNIPWSQP